MKAYKNEINTHLIKKKGIMLNMEELPKIYTEKGFFIITKIEYKNAEYLKCGNVNDFQIYFFKIKNEKIEKVDKNEEMELIEKFCYENDKTRIYKK